jgi:hypothetical protein
LGKGVVLAVETFPARDVVKNHHSIPGFELGHISANRCHHTRRFMTKDAGRGVRSRSNLLEVGPADAAGVHSKEKFACTDPRNWDGLNADVTDAAIHRRLHGGGNRFGLLRG